MIFLHFTSIFKHNEQKKKKFKIVVYKSACLLGVQHEYEFLSSMASVKAIYTIQQDVNHQIDH